jgi:hypothetical protein
LEHIAWESPAMLVMSRNRPIYSGSLATCVLYFRDQLSLTRKVVCHIALETGMVRGKTWLGPEDIHAIMTTDALRVNKEP